MCLWELDSLRYSVNTNISKSDSQGAAPTYAGKPNYPPHLQRVLWQGLPESSYFVLRPLGPRDDCQYTVIRGGHVVLVRHSLSSRRGVVCRSPSGSSATAYSGDE